MIMSSCFVLISSFICGAFILLSLLLSPPDFSSLSKNIKQMKIKNVFQDGLFVPITVPALIILVFILSVSITKEFKLANKTIITYKKCEEIKKEQEQKIAFTMPKCFIASR